MANLYDVLADAEDGQAMARLGREFRLTPQQTEAAVTALLPAISSGLKRSTATPEGLGNLFAVMGSQQDLRTMYDDPELAYAPAGRAAGNDVLSTIFGGPDVSRAVADQAQQFSGVGSGTLKKMLPVLAGILISALMGGKPGKAAAPQMPSSPGAGGNLGDVLGQIFGRTAPAPAGTSPSPQSPQAAPAPAPFPIPTGSGEQPGGGGDLLGYILREMEKGIREGRIKPVIIGGPIQAPLPEGQGRPAPIPMPGGQPAPAPYDTQAPGGDILGQVLRDLLGGAAGSPAGVPQRPVPSPQMKDLSDLSKQLGVMGGAGAAVFGERLDAGREVEQDHLDNIQNVFDRFFGR
jgi:hypothetical protein